VRASPVAAVSTVRLLRDEAEVPVGGVEKVGGGAGSVAGRIDGPADRLTGPAGRCGSAGGRDEGIDDLRRGTIL
jgi:hypothetical protein